MSCLAPYVFLSVSSVPEEQGRQSAQAALKILAGTPPSSIKMSTNKEIKPIVNQTVEKTSGRCVPAEATLRQKAGDCQYSLYSTSLPSSGPFFRGRFHVVRRPTDLMRPRSPKKT